MIYKLDADFYDIFNFPKRYSGRWPFCIKLKIADNELYLVQNIIAFKILEIEQSDVEKDIHEIIADLFISTPES